MVTILVCVLVIEHIFILTLGNGSYYRSNSSLFPIFLPLALVSLIVQYYLLRYSTKTYDFQKKNVFPISINVTQIIIMILITIVLLKAVPTFDSFFLKLVDMEVVLSSIVSISYVSATTLLGIIAYRFFRLCKINMNLVSLLYGLAFSVLTANAIVNLISIDIKLGYFVFLPIYAPESCGQFEAPPSCPEINFLLILTIVISFLLLWVSAIFKMYSYKDRLGKKIWTVILLPITLVLVPLFPFYFPPLAALLHFKGGIFMFALYPIIFYFLLRFIPAYAFGASFWILKKLVTEAKKQNAILVSGVGLFLYLTTVNQHVITFSSFVQYYIPIGIISLSLVGLFAYMINIVDVRNEVK